MPLESRRRQRAGIVEALRADGYTWEEVATDLRRHERCSALTALRWAHGFSQQDAADNFNKLLTADPDDAPINFRTIHRWEQWPHGGTMPPLTALNRLAKVYQVRASFLFDGEDHRHLDSAYSDQGGDLVTIPASSPGRPWIPSRHTGGRPPLAIAPPPPAASTARSPGLPDGPAPASMLLVLHGRNDMERRAVLAAIASLPGISLLPDTHGSLLEPEAIELVHHAVRRPESVGPEILKPFETLVMGCRQLDDALGGRYVAKPVTGIVRMLAGMLPAARPEVRQPLLSIAANAAQLAGWIAVDARDDATARKLYDLALEWATAADDAALVAHVWSCRSYHAGITGDAVVAVNAIQASRIVAAKHGGTKLRAWIEAKAGLAYGVAGDADETIRAMDRSADLLAPPDPEREPPWLYHFRPENLAVYRGIALTDAGQGLLAAEHFGDGLARLAPDFVRARGLYLANQARAFWVAGDATEACAAAAEAVRIGAWTGSAMTVATVKRVHSSFDARTARRPDARELGELLRDGAAAVEAKPM